MPMIGYGAMVVESLLGIVALVVVGAVAVKWFRTGRYTICHLLNRCCRIP